MEDWVSLPVGGGGELVGLEEAFRTRLAEDPGDILRVSRRDVVIAPGEGPVLRAATIETARGFAPGWDIHALEAEWRAVWARSGRPRLRSADAAFLGWLRKRG